MTGEERRRRKKEIKGEEGKEDGKSWVLWQRG
jgi:hypothetical protein